MRYILVMSLSGSMMFVLYLFYKCITQKKYSLSMDYLLLKAAAVYYLLPLPFIKIAYQKLIHYLEDSLWKEPKAILIYDTNKSCIVNIDGEIYFNHMLKGQLLAAVIWILVALCILMVQILLFLKRKKVLNKCLNNEIPHEVRTLLGELKKEYKIKRKISVVRCGETENSFTAGFFRPIVIYSEKREQTATELILRHEFIHIKRWDTLWLVLLSFVWIMHWWNPIVWWFGKQFEEICEYSCDELLMRGRLKEEKKKYAGLVITEARKKTEKRTLQLGIGKTAKKIEIRMENIMGNRKKMKCVTAAIVIGILILTNSLTVFAYENVYYEETSKELVEVVKDDLNISTLDENDLNENDFGEIQFAFFPDGMELCEVEGFKWNECLPEIIYDEQFVDEEGNIYPIQNQINTYAICEHQYISGTASSHHMNPDGGCTTILYSALRCTKCGHTEKGEEIGSYTLKVCPH